LELSGERGTILLEGDSIGHWRIDGEDPPLLLTEDLTNGAANPSAISAEGHRRQIAEMIEAIVEQRPPLIDGREGRRSLELVEAIYHSARDSRIVRLSPV
jgi:predicted dehydrogenase